MKHARDLMTKNPICVSLVDKIEKIVHLFLTESVKSIPVINEHKKVIGVLTEFGLVKCLIRSHYDESKYDLLKDLKDVLEDATTVHEKVEIVDVVKGLAKSQLNRVLVTQDISDALIGIISPQDLLSFVTGEKSETPKMKEELEKLESEVTVLSKENEELVDHLSQFKKVYENSNYMIHSVDKNFKIVMANKKLHEFLDYDYPELVGKSVFDMYPESDHSLVKSGLSTIEDSGSHSLVYSSFVDKHGWLKPVDISSTAMLDSDKKFISTFTISRALKSAELLKALNEVTEFTKLNKKKPF